MPYASEAQRRKFHAMADRGEVSKKTVAEYDRASKGKSLPERVGEPDTKAYAKILRHGGKR